MRGKGGMDGGVNGGRVDGRGLWGGGMCVGGQGLADVSRGLLLARGQWLFEG